MLTLVRGLPGSGKSTYAATLPAFLIEADMYFMVDGEYKFDATKLGEAHAWCLALTKTILAQGIPVVVANTFTTWKELKPYVELGYDTTVVDMKTQYKGTHNVPEATVERMKARWCNDFPIEVHRYELTST